MESIKKWLVSDGSSKGILLMAENCDIARKKANLEFYNPYLPKKYDLTHCQVYEENNHHLKNRLFKKVQYHTMGGVVTQYDCTIDTKPTQDQLNFLEREITHIKFYNDKKY